MTFSLGYVLVLLWGKSMLATLATNRVKVCECMMDARPYSSFSFLFELLVSSATL